MADHGADERGVVQPERVKHGRTCIGCGSRQGKGGLQRIVRTSAASAEFDASGRKAGRGAYVCSVECLEAARKNHRLERALKMKVTDGDYECIVEGIRRALCGTQG